LSMSRPFAASTQIIKFICLPEKARAEDESFPIPPGCLHC
jgi:hypothetical protein